MFPSILLISAFMCFLMTIVGFFALLVSKKAHTKTVYTLIAMTAFMSITLRLRLIYEAMPH